MSDSHLSPSVPYADENWSAVVAYARETRPDLVVHTGDLTFNGADDVNDLIHAKRRLDELPAPWLAIPGNHDIGDFGDTTQPFDAERRQRYTSVFGEGSWVTVLDGWRLVGVDVQALVADGPTSELWEWLEAVLAPDAGGTDAVAAPVALFVHRPVAPLSVDDVDNPHRFLVGSARQRLESLVALSPVRLVASGHVHQYRTGAIGNVAHVWAPSTWASLPDRVQELVGAKVGGVVEHEFLADRVESRLVTPPGMRQLVSGDDFKSPYPL